MQNTEAASQTAVDLILKTKIAIKKNKKKN